MAQYMAYAIIGTCLLLAACSGEPQATNDGTSSMAADTLKGVANSTGADANTENATEAAVDGGAEAAANATAAAEAATLTAEAQKKTEAEAKKRVEAGAKPVAEVTTADATPPAAFARCAVCHDATSARQDKIGPELYGAFGKVAGTHAPSYSYSEALKGSGLKWDAATLDKWLENPRALVPGNRMSFPGLKDPTQRQAIIDYLKAQS